jgi:hypothetical protein
VHVSVLSFVYMCISILSTDMYTFVGNTYIHVPKQHSGEISKLCVILCCVWSNIRVTGHQGTASFVNLKFHVFRCVVFVSICMRHDFSVGKIHTRVWILTCLHVCIHSYLHIQDKERPLLRYTTTHLYIQTCMCDTSAHTHIHI